MENISVFLVYHAGSLIRAKKAMHGTDLWPTPWEGRNYYNNCLAKAGEGPLSVPVSWGPFLLPLWNFNMSKSVIGAENVWYLIVSSSFNYFQFGILVAFILWLESYIKNLPAYQICSLLFQMLDYRNQPWPICHAVYSLSTANTLWQ